ncbi:ankyrin-1-like [Periplaneta americana]|uniref:ankyrin-1-like n=1 Tax=Periplaneta americana TaxID=6978 RepID=UPI0037E86E3D
MSVDIHPPLQYYVPFWPHPSPNQYSSQGWTPQIPESYLKPEVQLLLMQLLQQLQANSSETGTCDEFRNLAGREELARSNENRRCDKRTAQFSPGLPQGSLLDCMDSYSTNDTREGEILLQISLEKTKRSNLTRILEEKNKELIQLQKKAKMFIDTLSVPQDGRHFLQFRNELNQLHDKLWRMQYSFVEDLTQMEEGIQEFFRTNGGQEKYSLNKLKTAPNYTPRRRDFRSRGDVAYDEDDLKFFKEAILKNNLDSVKNIIADKKADINGIIDGKTPIMHAIKANALDIGEYLIHNGADIELMNDDVTPLQKAVTWNRVQFAELLLKNNADANAKSNGVTALYIAADKDLYNMSKVLLDYGADPNIFSGSFSALHIVRHAGIAKLLVEKGADVNACSPTRRNWTPLHQSAEKNHHEKAVFLIANGAELDLTDDWEITPLTLTATTNNQKLAHFLLLHHSDPNKSNETLMTAVKSGHLKLTKLLLEFNANVHTSDDRGWTAFHEAVSRDDEEMVALFLDFGADPDNAYSYAMTPREYAKEYELDVLSMFP